MKLKYICDALDAISIVACMLAMVGLGFLALSGAAVFLFRGFAEVCHDPQWRWLLVVLAPCVIWTWARWSKFDNRGISL
jgi:hypothetical protein